MGRENEEIESDTICCRIFLPSHFFLLFPIPFFFFLFLSSSLFFSLSYLFYLKSIFQHNLNRLIKIYDIFHFLSKNAQQILEFRSATSSSLLRFHAHVTIPSCISPEPASFSCCPFVVNCIFSSGLVHQGNHEASHVVSDGLILLSKKNYLTTIIRGKTNPEYEDSLLDQREIWWWSLNFWLPNLRNTWTSTENLGTIR